MRAVVISDSHGDSASINMVLRKFRTADMVIFLGDGENDFYARENSELIGNKKVVAVCGNCDMISDLPTEQTVTLGGKKIFALHGHTRGVKHGLEMLEHAAETIGADIAVYGHTHEAYVEYYKSIYYMCPGSIRNGSYGIIDIDDKTNTVLCYTDIL